MTALDDDAAPQEPILDTWTWKGDGAAWTAGFPLAPGEAVNPACADVIAGVLADLSPLARVHTATLLDDTGPTRLAWEPGASSTAFHARVIAALRSLPQPLVEVQLDLDLRAWFRTTPGAPPVLAWLRPPHTELVLWLADDGARAVVTFELTTTLFSAFTYPYADEANPLHALDQPLLEAALRRFAARSSEEVEVMGELPGRHALGFSADRDDY